MKKIIIALLVAFVVTIGISIYSDNMQAKIAQNVLRLHILANSDSEEDQLLKLSVRDKLLEESRNLFSGCSSPEESKKIFLQEKDRLTSVAENTIQSHGYAYPVSLSLEKTYFPTRYYENIAFPAGEYDAVRVEIGKAAGKNWWCVMFPPLCLDIASESAPADDGISSYTDEEIRLISGKKYNIKFKILELISDTFAKNG